MLRISVKRCKLQWGTYRKSLSTNQNTSDGKEIGKIIITIPYFAKKPFDPFDITQDRVTQNRLIYKTR